MQVPLFFMENVQEDFISLPAEESKHCIRVLRLTTNHRVDVTDGTGNLFKTIIHEANPKETVLKVENRIHYPETHPFRIHIAVAPTKNINRFEWFLEKATEIGIDEITPVICENSERDILKTDRLKRVMIAAMKQSIKYRMPKLNEPVAFTTFLEQAETSNAFIAWCNNDVTHSLANACRKNKNTVVLIGPEGDFSNEEAQMAIHKGFAPVSLGSSRLRTETAALVACHTVHIIHQIMHTE